MAKQHPGIKSPLELLLAEIRDKSASERDKGTRFEELILAYLTLEPEYRALYEKIWRFADWAREEGHKYGFDGRDVGIDLVARDRDGNWVAIQCKFYAQWHKVEKKDIDSFFTASGKKPFTRRLIVSTSSRWSEHAEAALVGQNPPVTVIKYQDLEQSLVDWSRFEYGKAPVLKAHKKLRPHQERALQDVMGGFQKHDRGKLIMPCGSGKTFTALKIAETQAGKGSLVVFFMPTLALLDQTIREWTQQSEIPITAFAVCSDREVGQKKQNDDEDKTDFSLSELGHPATTNAKSLALAVQKHYDPQKMTVIFSTYHSIEVITEAQKKHGLAAIDLAICDEAHRTTGYTFAGEEESAFVRVHDDKHIQAKKRLYMTATPRIYGENAKARADEEGTILCSMDDEKLFGPQLHLQTFHEAVEQGILVDYKVIVLAIEESYVSRRMQRLLADANNDLKVDDAARIIGCWKALSKIGPEFAGDETPMRRAVAFCGRIEYSATARSKTVASKLIAKLFSAAVEEYRASSHEPGITCAVRHVDGSMGAFEREDALAWLREGGEECRILSNVRCLSEGVDVPALDAALFLAPKKVQYEVVQAVGRVMRISPGKKYGYVILPVVIPAGMEPNAALDNNEVYKHVWQVLQALRSHDDRFDAEINKMDLNGFSRKRINVIHVGENAVEEAITPTIAQSEKKMEVVTVVNDLPRRAAALKVERASAKLAGLQTIGQDVAVGKDDSFQLNLEFGDIERAIYARVVQKCGNRRHWEEWAHDIARIANTHIDRIKAILENKANVAEKKAFQEFAEELRDDLNEQISDEEIIEMLAQHMITKPVFDALFENYSFAAQNPVSRALDKVLKSLAHHHLEKETATLQKFYDSVRLRASGIESAAGRQKIILELYDKFFRGAFPKLSDRLGIVYTPVEIVDFINRSIEEILQREFNSSLADDNVHIVDPFAGTGTFITRLLQSDLIPRERLEYKYKNEIHANEMVLLAYYIAAINIESVFHDLHSGAYQPFPGICFTDTFQLYEKDDLISRLLVDNSNRRERQKNLDIRVILGNPPYSSGQSSANDNNQNTKYAKLDSRIAETYAKHSTAALQNKLYDSYIRAIRWASDRLGTQGVIGFVTNAGWIDSNSADGLRKCLAEEFAQIYVFHLRGNQRTAGDTSRKEGGKIFGGASRAPIAISFFIKHPNHRGPAEIYFHDIGDYLSREQKFEKIREFGSIAGITQASGWQKIVPDKFNDWLNQRDDSFFQFLKIGDKKDKAAQTIFENYSLGIATNRDVWVYNFSRQELQKNMRRTIDFYNSELARWQKAKSKGDIKKFLTFDSKKITWVEDTVVALSKLKKSSYSKQAHRIALYRPFTRMHLYWDSLWNQRQYQIPRIFPQAGAENRVICVTGRGAKNQMSCIMTDVIPDLNMLEAGAQCFPLYLYESSDRSTDKQAALFRGNSARSAQIPRRYAITDAALRHFQNFYAAQDEKGGEITKEDIFYYIYGLLHSSDYRTRYANNLAKELPRIPCVASFQDFKAFCEAGRRLAELHVGYERVAPYPVQEIHSRGAPAMEKQRTGDRGSASAMEKRSTKGVNSPSAMDFRSTQTPIAMEIHSSNLPPEKLYHLDKMRFGRIAGKTGREGEDRSTIVYNPHITLRNIPLAAYDYVVNGKSAIEWVMERYQVKEDKDSGIVNDPNDYALETAQDPRYIVKLLLRVVTVSLESVRIVADLPALKI